MSTGQYERGLGRVHPCSGTLQDSQAYYEYNLSLATPQSSSVAGDSALGSDLRYCSLQFLIMLNPIHFLKLVQPRNSCHERMPLWVWHEQVHLEPSHT